MAKESGASTALVTCLTSEAKLDQADVVLRTTYRDRSSAFTISHMGAMTGLALAASKVAGGEALGEELKSLPDAVASALKTEPDVKSMVAKVRDYEWYCFAGWGPNASTAYEAALKINEAAYDVTTAFQLEQFLHGPYVATDQRCVVTLVAPPGPGYGRAVEIGKAVKATGGGLAALVAGGRWGDVLGGGCYGDAAQGVGGAVPDCVPSSAAVVHVLAGAGQGSEPGYFPAG